jgi:hypothetical protein
LVRKVLITIAAFAVFPVLLAQQTLNNDSVIKMVKMGFPEDMIVNAINRSPGTYDTTVGGMITLKSAGVGNKAISAMVLKGTAPTGAPQAPAAPAAPPADVPPPTVSVPRSLVLAASPTVPPAAEQPSRVVYASSATRPRVFLQAQSHGNLWNAARDQSMEMSKDFERNCPGVRISLNRQMSDYTVALSHIERGFVRDNQIQVANRDGDLISKTKEGGSINGRVKKACDEILTDWAANGVVRK